MNEENTVIQITRVSSGVRGTAKRKEEFLKNPSLRCEMEANSVIFLAYAAHKSITVFSNGRKNCFLAWYVKRRRVRVQPKGFIDLRSSKPCLQVKEGLYVVLKQSPKGMTDIVHATLFIVARTEEAKPTEKHLKEMLDYAECKDYLQGVLVGGANFFKAKVWLDSGPQETRLVLRFYRRSRIMRLRCTMPNVRDVDHHDTASYIPLYHRTGGFTGDERDIYKSLVYHLFYEGRVVLPDFLEDKPNLRPTFRAIGFDFLLDIDEKICPVFVLQFYKGFHLIRNLNRTICVRFTIDNVETILTLENFAQILRILCEGVCLYSHEWSISSLQRILDPHPNLHPYPIEEPSLIRDALFKERPEPIP
ncbi:hypothetical protein Tco_0393587 [Tanacetum coccineum]